MTIHDTASTAQAVRCVYENGHAVIDNGAGTIKIVCQPDASSGKNIILWDDITAVFGNALYVRSGDFALPFLKGPDFKNLDPPRIAAIPGVTLDVVVTGPAVVASPPPSALNQIAQQASQFPKYDPLSALQSHPWTPTSHLTIGNNIPRTFNHHRAPVILTSRRQSNDTAARTHKRALELNKVKAIIRKIAVCTDLDALHAKGDGRPQDFRKALECYLKTVQKGQAQALISVGDLFLQQSPTIAMGWYLKAAYLGDNNARYKIDQLRLELPRLFSSSQAPLLEGLKDAQQDKHRDKDTAGNSSLGATTVTVGEPASSPNQNDSSVPPQEVLPTPTSFTLELANMMARAESGNHVAQETLGDMCLDGRVVPKDVQAAIDWYLRADSEGSSTAIERKLRSICLSNLGVTQEYLMAVDRHHKTAVQGNFTAQRNLGDLYLAAQDYAEAMTWFRKAAEQGDAAAQLNIGYLYDQGLGVSQDYAEAMTWFRKAAEQGYATAQLNIGYLYDQGLGVSQDYAEAMIWYRKAAEQGDAQAQNNIGYLYQQGLGVSQNYAEAMTWYRTAAEQGYATAQHNIGYLYDQGLGVSQNYAKAMIWYRKAVEQGHATQSINCCPHSVLDVVMSTSVEPIGVNPSKLDPIDGQTDRTDAPADAPVEDKVIDAAGITLSTPETSVSDISLFDTSSPSSDVNAFSKVTLFQQIATRASRKAQESEIEQRFISLSAPEVQETVRASSNIWRFGQRGQQQALEAKMRSKARSLCKINLSIISPKKEKKYSRDSRVYRLAVFGDGGTDKTELVIQFCRNRYTEDYDPTTEDSYTKYVVIDEEPCVLDVMDTSGHEDFSAMVDLCIRGSDGFVLVYSIAARSTFESVQQWHDKILHIKSKDDVPIILVGNECNKLTEREVSRDEGALMAKTLRCGFIEADARTGVNVERSFYNLVRMIRQSLEGGARKAN